MNDRSPRALSGASLTTRAKALLGTVALGISGIGGVTGMSGMSVVASAVLPAPAAARTLDCGKFEFPHCQGEDHQFDRKFKGREAYGGFGGGDCKATRTPVVFIHGNGDAAIGWDSDITAAVPGYAKAPRSVYDELRARGYNECELWGISYLSKDERETPQSNYHQPDSYRTILAFINAVQKNTGARQVDVVAHSLGVSMTLAALTWSDERSKRSKAWGDVRRFVNIAGGLRGLGACKQAGPANPMVTTCGSQNLLDRSVFGFYPDGFGLARNRWTGDGADSLRRMPQAHAGVAFYTIHAGDDDQIHCDAFSKDSQTAPCRQGALFAAAPNVRAQLDIGAPSNDKAAELDFKDKTVQAKHGGDAGGVGHFKARNNTGAIIWQMLNSECRGIACKGSYAYGPVKAD